MPPSSYLALSNGRSLTNGAASKHTASLRNSISSTDNVLANSSLAEHSSLQPELLETPIPSASIFDDDPFWTSKMSFSVRGSILMPDEDKRDLVAEGAKLGPSNRAVASPAMQIRQERMLRAAQVEKESIAPVSEPLELRTKQSDQPRNGPYLESRNGRPLQPKPEQLVQPSNEQPAQSRNEQIVVQPRNEQVMQPSDEHSVQTIKEQLVLPNSELEQLLAPLDVAPLQLLGIEPVGADTVVNVAQPYQKNSWPEPAAGPVNSLPPNFQSTQPHNLGPIELDAVEPARSPTLSSPIIKSELMQLQPLHFEPVQSDVLTPQPYHAVSMESIPKPDVLTARPYHAVSFESIPSIRVQRPRTMLSRESLGSKRRHPEPSMQSSLQRQDPATVEAINRMWTVSQSGSSNVDLRLDVAGSPGSAYSTRRSSVSRANTETPAVPQVPKINSVFPILSSSPNLSANLSSKQSDNGVPPSTGSPSTTLKIASDSAPGKTASDTTLSEEERSVSRRVRSMYEQGGSKYMYLAEAQPASPASKSGNAATFSTTTSAARTRSLTAGSSRPVDSGTGLGVSVASSRKGTKPKELPREAAGGLEDWTNVFAGDLDRYGFIHAKKSALRNPTASPALATSSSIPIHAVVPEGREGRLSTSAGASARVNGGVTKRLNQRKSYLSARPLARAPSQDKRSSLAAFGLFSRNRTVDPTTMLIPLPRITPRSPAEHDRIALERRREAKWTKMARRVPSHASRIGGMQFTFDTSNPKLISRTWKGIPDRWRSVAWHAFCTASARRQQGAAFVPDVQLVAIFHELQCRDCADDAQIDLDVPRTIGAHILFRSRYRGGQRLLFRVLRALALRFPRVGYVQGMAALASTLLCYYDEEMAFVLAVRLWETRGLAALYGRGFEALMQALATLDERWTKGTAVGAALAAQGVQPSAWGTRWYLTLFGQSLPFSAQLRVWDVFILLGDPVGAAAAGSDGVMPAPKRPNLDVLHAVAAAMLQGLRGTLLRGEFEDSMSVLTAVVPVAAGREDVLMSVAKAIWREKGDR